MPKRIGLVDTLPLDRAREIFDERYVNFEVINKGDVPVVKAIIYGEENKDKIIKPGATIDQNIGSIPVGDISEIPDAITIGHNNTWYLVGENDYVYIVENSVEKSINRYFGHLSYVSEKSDNDVPDGVKKRFARATSRYNLPIQLVAGFGLKNDSQAHAAYVIDDNKMTIVPGYFVRMGVVRVGGQLIDEFSKTVIHEFGHAIWHQVLSDEEKARYIATAPRFLNPDEVPDIKDYVRGHTDTLTGKRIFGEFLTNKDDKFLTDYARMSVKEDFAETFLFFVLAPDYLLGFDKQRYDFINSIKVTAQIDNLNKGTLILPEKQDSVEVSDLLSIDLQTSELRRKLALEFEVVLKRLLDGSKIGLEHLKNLIPYGTYVKADEQFPEDLRVAIYAEDIPNDLEATNGNIKLAVYNTQEKLDALIYQSRVIATETKVDPDVNKLDEEIDKLMAKLDTFDVRKVEGGVVVNKRFYRKNEIERWVTTSTGRHIPIPKEGVQGRKIKSGKSKAGAELESIRRGKKAPPSKKRLPLGHIGTKPSTTNVHLNRPKQTTYSLQRHYSRVAPEHFDLRLKMGDKAHSWAVQEWPMPGTKTLAILQPPHSTKYMSFQGTIREGYGAGRVDLADLRDVDVTDWTDKKKAFNVYSGPQKGRYALINIGEKNYLLVRKKQIHKPLAVEYVPSRARLKLKEEMWEDPNFVIQAKMNGARSMLYVSKEGNRVLSRSMSAVNEGHVDQTDIVPHIRDMNFGHGDLVLDGEMFIKDKYTTSAILNSNPIRARKLQNQYGKLKLYVFDILRYNGNDLRNIPYKTRLQFLERAVGNNPNVKVIPSFTENKKAYYKKLVKMGYEGIVLKDLRGKYNDRFMTKKKPIHDDDYVIMGSTEGKGKYKGLFGALIFGKYVDGKLVRVGKVGSGFNEKERIKINRKLKTLIKNKTVMSIRHLGLSHKGTPEGAVFDRFRTSKTFHDMLAESLGEQSPSVNAG